MTPQHAAAGKGDVPVRWLLCHMAGLPAIRNPLPPKALYHWSQMTLWLVWESHTDLELA